jgi:hypothetical protein
MLKVLNFLKEKLIFGLGVWKICSVMALTVCFCKCQTAQRFTIMSIASSD